MVSFLLLLHADHTLHHAFPTLPHARPLGARVSHTRPAVFHNAWSPARSSPRGSHLTVSPRPNPGPSIVASSNGRCSTVRLPHLCHCHCYGRPLRAILAVNRAKTQARQKNSATNKDFRCCKNKLKPKKCNRGIYSKILCKNFLAIGNQSKKFPEHFSAF